MIGDAPLTPLPPRGSERRPVPEADLSVPEVFKDGGSEGFLCVAAALDAVAPMVLRAAGERGGGRVLPMERGWENRA